MRGDASGRPNAAERERLEAAIVEDATPGYVSVRALVALGDESTDRLARSTAMGREFVAEVRRRVAAGRSAALLAAKPGVTERTLEIATAEIVAAGRCELSMGSVAAALGISRRTLHRQYSSNALIEACRRRALTIWRARFEHRIYRADPDPVRRLFLVVDAIAAWVASERFRDDQVLRPALSDEVQGNDLREHLAAVERFATRLAQHAQVAEPRAFGIFIATNVAGAAAWVDYGDEAHAAARTFVERLARSPNRP